MRPLADRAKDAAGNLSGPNAALIRELTGEVERLRADLDRLKGWPVAVKTAKDEVIEELTAEVKRLARHKELMTDQLKFVLKVVGRQTAFYRKDACLARLVIDTEAVLADVSA